MGQFLATGLVTEMTISKKEADNAGYDFDKISTLLEQKMFFPSEIYEKTEHDEYYELKLKKEILHTQLLPFLEAFYPKMYHNFGKYKSVLSKLKDTEPVKYLDWAEDKPAECYQLDEYAMSETLGSYPKYVRVNFEIIMLAIEGKIEMEAYGTQFNFFKYCMAQTFKDFSISSALRVYITG